MMTTKLLVASLLVIGLSGFGLAAYAVGPNGASSVLNTTPSNLSNSGERIYAGTSESDDVTFDASETITDTEAFTGSIKIATAIANYFKVPTSDIVQLHNGGWGYGEIFRLYALTKAAGKTVGEVKAMREAGQGWGEIAKTLNMPPGNRGANLGSIMRKQHGNQHAEKGKGKSKSAGGKGEDEDDEK